MPTLALVGNQNCGKTTLFNLLTGSNQHVGNFPGVTVEKKEGIIKKLASCTLVDLPGIYSLSPYTSEERVTRDFLIKNSICGIVNIVDATNMERNLYLTLQLMELELPLVLVLNMMDEVEKNGNSIDCEALKRHLGVSVVPISAVKNQGIDGLIQKIEEMVKNPLLLPRPNFYSEPIYKVRAMIDYIVADKVLPYPIPFCVTKLLEGEELEGLSLNESERQSIEAHILAMEQFLDMDRVAALADMRYFYIEEICSHCISRNSMTKQQNLSMRLDTLFTHRIWGMPLFLILMLSIFYLSFTLLGEPLKEVMNSILNRIEIYVVRGLMEIYVSSWIISLIKDGIFEGVGSVLSFLPVILLLFFFLSILEDSGYMARVAFVMDKFLQTIGLSGHAFVPMLIGFGCSVPAIMATRTLVGERERRKTILIIPFLSCSAKLSIYGMMISAFYARYSGLVIILIYTLGIVVAILCAFFLKEEKGEDMENTFVMELPAYRFPTWRTVCLTMWERAKEFIHKAFTMLFLCSILIWFLQNFNYALLMVNNREDSILASMGSVIAPLFKPLGFADWRAVTAILTGIMAKENVVSTLLVLSNTNKEVGDSLYTIFTPLSAFSFLIFTLLYMPCIATFTAIKREMGSWIETIKIVLIQTTIAYFVAMLIYQLGSIFVK